MIIEILCEDKSSVPVLHQIFEQLQNEYEELFDVVNIFPHRGKGKLPDSLSTPPKPFSSSLLDLLPAKVRAYDKIYQKEEIVLIVVLDADNQNESTIYQNIEYVMRQEAPNKYFVIGIPVEEMEAWLLGDRKAVKDAYPNADFSLIEEYQQDEVNHTWEFLAKAILHERAERLIKAGYPAVGIYKNRWATEIAPYLNINENQSPSFAAFIERFRRVMSWVKEDRDEAN